MRVGLVFLTAVMAIQLSCTSRTIDSERTVEGVFDQVSSIELLEDSPAKAPVPPKNNDEFYVSVELIVFKKEVEKYPVTWENIAQAIDKWKSLIPVRFLVVVMDPITNPAFLASETGAIVIHLGDLQDKPYGFPEGVLGMWYSPKEELFFDADTLEGIPDKAYTVALHELGHMFGVPHVVGFFQHGTSGSIVLPLGADPTERVMYAYSIKSKQQSVLSNVEIMLARFNLIHHWTRPDRKHGMTESCSLFPLDKGD